MIEPVGGVVDQLLAELDALAGEDLTPLFGPAQLDRLRPLLAAQNRLAAEIARTVRECEISGAAEVDELTTMPFWLRGHGHLCTAEAARVVRAGRALAHLPAMAAAFTAGGITGEQAALIARVAEREALALAAEQGIDLVWWTRCSPAWPRTARTPTPPRRCTTTWSASMTTPRT